MEIFWCKSKTQGATRLKADPSRCDSYLQVAAVDCLVGRTVKTPAIVFVSILP